MTSINLLLILRLTSAGYYRGQRVVVTLDKLELNGCSHEVKVTEVTTIKAFVNFPVEQLMTVTKKELMKISSLELTPEKS